MKRWLVIGAMLVVGGLLTACGTENSLLSPQEVVNTMLQESDEPLSYYGEYTMFSDLDMDNYEVKEWITKEQKRRIELTSTNENEQLIAVNDRETMTLYDEVDNTAMVMSMGEDDLFELGNQTPREQAETMLEMVKDSHELSTGEDAEIAGRSTYHIIAKVKDSDTLFGDMDIWIDKETWFPLKTVTNNAGNQLSIEYTKIDFKAEIPDDLFVLDLPEDTVVEVVEEEAYESKNATVEEVLDELGSFYQLREEDGLELTELTVLEGMEERAEFTFEYKKDGMDALSLTVFKDLPNVVDFGGMRTEEEVTIRGKQVWKLEMGEFRAFDWVEAGLGYSIVMNSPVISFEEVEQYMEKMTLTE